VRLAFVAALQHLPARQRAVLILRDVADLPADEVATVLDTTTVAVNSALLRARERMSREAPDPAEMSEPTTPEMQNRLLRYVDAWTRADVGALAAVLREDVTLEMPPHASWFAGRDPVLGFLGTHVFREPGFFACARSPRGPTASPRTRCMSTTRRTRCRCWISPKVASGGFTFSCSPSSSEFSGCR
jgi:RNA polymerase sigma-70 factor (ECF subfamily)